MTNDGIDLFTEKKGEKRRKRRKIKKFIFLSELVINIKEEERERERDG